MPAKKRTAPQRSSGTTAKPAFASVAVVVSDRERSLDWYTKNLGLDLVDRMDHWVTVGRKGQNGLLHLCQISEIDPSAPLESGNSGILLSLRGDFPTACAALEARGVRFTSPPKKEPWGWTATIADPDGNEIWLGPGD